MSMTYRNDRGEEIVAYKPMTQAQLELYELAEFIRHYNGDVRALSPALAVRAKIAAGLDPKEH